MVRKGAGQPTYEKQYYIALSVRLYSTYGADPRAKFLQYVYSKESNVCIRKTINYDVACVFMCSKLCAMNALAIRMQNNSN